MLATGVRTSSARIQARRQKHALPPLQSTAHAPKPVLNQCKCLDVARQRDQRHVKAAGLPFFGGIGCLPLLILGPFVAAIFAVWSILATIQFIIVTTILLARSAAKMFFSSESKDAAAGDREDRPQRSNMVIDIEPDPEVSKAYKDLDDDLDRFDQDLRKRNRR